jgi:hypothetical protein
LPVHTQNELTIIGIHTIPDGNHPGEPLSSRCRKDFVDGPCDETNPDHRTNDMRGNFVHDAQRIF